MNKKEHKALFELATTTIAFTIEVSWTYHRRIMDVSWTYHGCIIDAIIKVAGSIHQ